jgi:hypothetical protein
MRFSRLATLCFLAEPNGACQQLQRYRQAETHSEWQDTVKSTGRHHRAGLA